MSSFGENLRKIRENKKLSQEALARLLGTTKQVISRYENGQRTPKISIVEDYAAKLGVSFQDLSTNHKPGFWFFFFDEEGKEQPSPETVIDLPPLVDPMEIELVDIYRGLNDVGQQALLGTARGLNANPDMQKDGKSSDAMA